MPLNSTPSVWGDLGLAGQNQQTLKDQQELMRKKKLMAAAGTDMKTAVQQFFGQGMPGAGMQRMV